MIWRLMAAILTISEPGSASTTTETTDWPTEVQCRQILDDFYRSPPPTKVNGRLVTIKIQASCVPVVDEEVASIPDKGPLPPPPVMLVPPLVYNDRPLPWLVPRAMPRDPWGRPVYVQ